MRERVTLPPTGWRPRSPTTSEKLDIVIRQEGRCAVTGNRLGTLKETRFDHRPPIHERPWDEAKQDTIPPGAAVTWTNPATGVVEQLIFAIDRRTHEQISGRDNSRMAKVDRIRSAEDRHRAALDNKGGDKERPAKPKRRMQSRGFDRSFKRPMRGPAYHRPERR